MQPYSPVQVTQAGPLGALIEEFKGASLSNTIYGVILLLLGGASLAAYVTDTQNNLPFAFIGIIILVGAAALFVVSALNSRNIVQVYQGGLVATRGAQSETIPWDSVVTYYQRVIRYRYNLIVTYTVRRYIVERADGKRFTFSQYQNVQRLGEIIARETAARQLPRAQAAFQAGQTIAFGKLSLSQAGLSNGKETIPWSEVSGVQVANGAILISRQGKRLAWARQSVQNTPNAQVLLTLVQNLAGRR